MQNRYTNLLNNKSFDMYINYSFLTNNNLKLSKNNNNFMLYYF